MLFISIGAVGISSLMLTTGFATSPRIAASDNTLENAGPSDDTLQELLSLSTDRRLEGIYTNNEGVIVSGNVSKQILDDGQKLSSYVYFPNGTIYSTRNIDVLSDGSYTYRVDMETIEMPAGEYKVSVTYGDQRAVTSFIHAVEHNQDPTYAE